MYLPGWWNLEDLGQQWRTYPHEDMDAYYSILPPPSIFHENLHYHRAHSGF